MSAAASGTARTFGGGEVVRGYRIVRSLGEGPVGFVFAAELVATGAPCAIEFVRVADPTGAYVARLRHSATLVSPLRDGRLVEMFGAFAWDDEMLALASELAEGDPLSTLLGRHGPLKPNDALRLIQEVAASLANAHAAGVVHGNLTPRCIWLARDGAALVVRLLGLGTGWLRPLVPAPERSAFVAPELANNVEPSPAADVYALGAIARACLDPKLLHQSGADGTLVRAGLAAFSTAVDRDARRRPSMAALAGTF